MHCPECGANLPDDALYCGMCGKRLDEEDPALFSYSSMIGGPPTGLTGPLPQLTEEELAALLRKEGEQRGFGDAEGFKERPTGSDDSSGEPADLEDAAEAAGTDSDRGDLLDFGETAEVGGGEEFGRKAVSFEGIYQETGADEALDAEQPGTGELTAEELSGAFMDGYLSENEEDNLPQQGSQPETREEPDVTGQIYDKKYSREAYSAAFAGNGASPDGNGGWKRTLLISFFAIAATAALVFWTVRTLGGGGDSGQGTVTVTPTITQNPGTGSGDSGASKAESVVSGDSKTESTPSGDSKTESTASGDSKTESAASGDSKTESTASGDSKTDSKDESQSGRRRVTATPTPTLLPTLSPTPRPTATPTPVPKTDADYIRLALGDKNAVLLYVSDAGSAWHTELTLRNDATFSGNYEEMVVEVAGDHEMIVRNSTFTGHVYDCKKQKDGTYSMRIKVRMNGSEGESHLEGNKRYVTVKPKGLNTDDEIILYTPGTSTKGLPEGLLGWLRRARGSEITSAQLPCYCIIDLNTGYGFGEYQ